MIPFSVRRLWDTVRRFPEAWALRRIRRQLIREEFGEEATFEAYRRELETSGLLDHLKALRERFAETVEGKTPRGSTYGFGGIGFQEAVNLYALVRHRQPEKIVETGVCNGLSTAVVLQALATNGTGHLWSIDLPEIAGQDTEAHFWEGKGGAVIPAGKEPGWVIPDELRDRWTLIIGKSQDKLPDLLDELGEIDLFIHDSEHSYECMRFEFDHAYQALRPEGLLVADDISWNRAFDEFIDRHDLSPGRLGPDIGFVSV